MVEDRVDQQGVQAWWYSGTLLERYDYVPGPVAAPHRHAHAAFQVGLSIDAHGEYRIKGRRYYVERGALSVIHPGEVHQSRDADPLPAPATYHLLYVDSSRLLEALGSEPGSPPPTPTFPDLSIADPDLARHFLRFCAVVEQRPPDPEAGGLLLAVLRALTGRHARDSLPLPPDGAEHRAVALAREVLHEYWNERLDLAHLSRLAGLSSFHLSRAFARATGLPPHAYQINLRVEHARRLLLEGWPVVHVAVETGFHDASHFSRHFSRLVGTPPGRYARNSKNVHASWRCRL